MGWHKAAAASLLAVAMALGLGTGAAQAQERKKLIFIGAGSVPTLIYLPVYVADKAGLFAEEGIEVETRYGRGGPLTMQVVAAGGADVAHIVWQPLIAAYQKGARGRFIYQTFTRSSFFLAVTPDSPIKEPKDLVAKKLGVVNMASPGIFFAKSMLKSAGGDAESLTFVPVNVGAQPLAALQAKQVDALSLYDGVYADYEAQGVKLRYIQHPVIGSVGNGGFVAMDDTIAKKKAELQAFTRAVAKATVFILANPEAALKMYWEVNPDGKVPGTEAEALAKGTVALKFIAHSWDIGKRPVQQYGYINKDEIQSFIDILQKDGGLSGSVDAGNLLTNDLIKGANDFDLKAMQARAAGWKK
jgi:NitT/TauT family transport system substrate-binding protein